MPNLASIPAKRLALLDTATLSQGSHLCDPSLTCGRELLHKVVTGVCLDTSPDGYTHLTNILPVLNDGPFLNCEQRTAAIRPHLRKFLMLDPRKDEEQAYALIDHLLRSIIPALPGMSAEYAANLRALPPAVDLASSQAILALYDPYTEHYSVEGKFLASLAASIDDNYTHTLIDAIIAVNVFLDSQSASINVEDVWAKFVNDFLSRIPNAASTAV